MLLIDIGNTRIKWARVDVRGLGDQSAAVHATWTEQDFVQQVLNAGPKAERVVIANVGGKRMGDLAQTAVLQHWHVHSQFMQSPAAGAGMHVPMRSEEQTPELHANRYQSYALFC